MHQLSSVPSISKKAILAGKLDSYPIRSSLMVSWRVAKDCREGRSNEVRYAQKMINGIDSDDLL